MKKPHILRAEIVIIAALILAIILPQVIGTTSPTAASRDGTVASLADLNGRTFATVIGSAYEDYIYELFPDAELMYVNDWSSMPLAVSMGKADAFLVEASSLEEYIAEYDDLTAFPSSVAKMEVGFAASKTELGTEAAALFNEYLAEATADGTLKALYAKWADVDTAPDHIDRPAQTDTSRGTLRIVSAPDWAPFCYENGTEPCGYFIELVFDFCAWAGYEPDFELVPYESAMSGMGANHYDLMAYGMVYSPERAENMIFTDTIYAEDIYAVIPKSEAAYAVTDAHIADYEGRKITVAVQAGSDGRDVCAARFPDAELMEFITLSDVYVAVSTGKADIGMSFDDQFAAIQDTFDNLGMLYEAAGEMSFGFATQKTAEGKALCDAYNAYADSIIADGTYDAILAKWSSGDEALMHNEACSFSGEKGILKVATTGAWYPMSFYVGEELSGRFIDLINGFCAAEGYVPEYSVLQYGPEMAGLLAGEYDIVADGCGITPERLEQVYITDGFISSEVKLIVPVGGDGSGEAVSKASVFLSGLVKSFEKNFIRESRWRMLLSGLWVTVALSVLAGVCGTVLGAVICAMRMSRNDYLTGFARIYIKIIQGTPIVVLLMVLYYIVFGKADAPAFWVCVLGFSLDFAAYSSEIFRSGIAAVPDGQRMAARALGFSRGKAFTKVILPQAMIHIVPVFTGQFIAMVELTSVAGYISVQDLTKVSDIIRSRTFEAFFPLISTALIYFVIAALLISVLKLAERRIDPALRPRKLKGVKTDAD